jgi:uncharacterized protein DUF2334
VHWLDPVRAAIDAAPASVNVFFRDDDAGWATERLRALLDVFSELDLPLDLAVIPRALDEPLAAELLVRAMAQPVYLHQHGFTHANHEPEGRKYEFGPHRSRGEQHHDIAAGATRLHELLGDAVQPIFTPPWNRCTADTGHALVDLGFKVLSRESRAPPLDIAGLAEVPIRVDWLKPDVVARLTTAIADGGRIGLMFHHADTDIARAAELLTLLARHDRVTAGTILNGV